jgi:bifunctional UDP-N-acetylglucosamine pyrophosphorylase/glucosamine-1-phosphate N-acetyltransferase
VAWRGKLATPDRGYDPGVTAPTVVILAAGHGTRMRSATPKMLHEICGRPMVQWPILAAREAGAGRVVVVGGPDGALDGALPEGVELAVQREARGTGDAVRAAAASIDGAAPVVVINGDVPLITPQLISALAEEHQRSGAAATLATIELDDPTGYGRVVRGPDGGIEHVAETKAEGDAAAPELAIREVNTGVYAFDGPRLLDALERIQPDNSQGEYYLPDVLKVFRGDDHGVAGFPVADAGVVLGVNDRVDLARVRALAQRRIHEAHMRAGVTIVDPASTVVDADVRLGPDTVVEPATYLRGTTRVGERCRIGPLTTVLDAALGDAVTVLHSYLVQCEVHDGALLGPFAYLRPGTVVRQGAKVGTFVEVKNSDIGAGAKVPHLTYLGDADVGESSNIGAGTITANYDGFRKHRTRIGDRVHGGVDTSFVAPVEVGDDAWTGAGSVIVDDVPPGALGVAREPQSNVEGYDQRKRSEEEKRRKADVD